MPLLPKTRIRFALFGCLVLVAPLRAQTERRSLSGDRVAIYNLAGKLRVESGRGSDVEVEITRGGRDADQLRIEQGNVGGRQTLRVIYPADRVVYPERGRSDRTTINVRDDGTWVIRAPASAPTGKDIGSRSAAPVPDSRRTPTCACSCRVASASSSDRPPV